jgi:hypothetical protein
MIIKRWNAGTTAWVEHYPKTVVNQLFNTAGTTTLFDSNNKLKPNYLPDSVFDSLYFFATTTSGDTRARAAAAFANALTINRSSVGHYFVATAGLVLTASASALTTIFTRTFSLNDSSPIIEGDISGLTVGMVVVGSGVPTGATIISINASEGTITLSGDATVTSFRSLNFQKYFQTILSGGEESNTYVREFTLANGSSTITAGDTSNLEIGMRVVSTGNIPGNATITAINANGTSFTLSANATSDGDFELTFNPPIFPASVGLETGDWFIISDFTGSGTIGSPYVVTFAVVNNTYEIMKAATSTTAGAPGLVPAPLAGEEGLYLRGDGNWETPTNTTYGIATTDTAGLVELAHAKITTALTVQTAGTETNRYYGVRLNNADQMIVNVPWENTTYGIAAGDTLGLIKTGYAQENTQGLVSVPVENSKASARQYGVQVDSSGSASVYVPWENTTYSEATTSAIGLVEITYAKQATARTVANQTITDGRFYGITLNNNSQAIVNVPWENTEYTAGVGLGLSSEVFSMNQPHVVSAAEPATTYRKDNTLWFFI